MNIKKCQSPVGWENDDLTRYLEQVRNNQWATFDNKRSEVSDLITIDAMFRTLFDGAINPEPLLPINFFFRAHCAFRSACGAAMAGQVHDVHALLRVSLEQGGYALYVGEDQKRWERWIGRHDPRTRSQQSKWREEFTHGKVARCVTQSDSDLGRVYATLYDQTIEYGAHPNERGSLLSMVIDETEDGKRRYNTVYLHGDGLSLDFVLKTTAQVGICVLQLAKLIYPHRAQLTGVEFQLEAISKRF